MRPIGFIPSLLRRSCLALYLEDSTVKTLLRYLKAFDDVHIPPDVREEFLKARTELESASMYARDVRGLRQGS